jgi:maltose O-acetyltransferase
MRLPRFIPKLLKQIRCRRIFKRWTESEQALDLLPGYCILDGNNIELGIGVHFGNNIYIDGRGGITIGSNVIFAPNVSILTANHNFRNPEWKPYSPEFIMKKVTIGNHCWFGRGCMILPGARVGNNCIIGAGSVVSGEIPDNSVAAGNPAKVIDQTHYNPNAKPYMVIHGKMRRFG